MLSSGTIQVSIKDLVGLVLVTLRLKPNHIIWEVKRMIEDEIGVFAGDQRLTLKGTPYVVLF